MLKISPTRYFWYLLKFPKLDKSTIPKATDVEENTPMIVSALDFPFIFIVMIAVPNRRENKTILTVTSLIPNKIPKAIPVRAECPMASLKNAILFDTTLVPKRPNNGDAKKIANKAFFIKFGSAQENGSIKSKTE